jgi:hypothetical protein
MLNVQSLIYFHTNMGMPLQWAHIFGLGLTIYPNRIGIVTYTVYQTTRRKFVRSTEKDSKAQARVEISTFQISHLQ